MAETRYIFDVPTYNTDDLDARVRALSLGSATFLGLCFSETQVVSVYDGPLSPGDVTTLNDSFFAYSWSQAQEDAYQLGRLRTQAGSAITAREPHAMLTRAVLAALLDRLNTMAGQHDALLAWLGTQTTLTQRAQLAGFSLGQVTVIQARAAVASKISGGGAD